MFNAVPRRTVFAGLMAVGLAATLSAHTLPGTTQFTSMQASCGDPIECNTGRSVPITAASQDNGTVQFMACDPDTCNTHVQQGCDPENCGAQL